MVSGDAATVGGGLSNMVSGFRATVPGGLKNSARGFASFAAGSNAKSIHDGTFVWSDRSITSGNDSLVSTGSNQFLIRAAGGVGIGTNSPDEQLHILNSNAGSAIKLGGGRTGGPHGIVFDDNTPNAGVRTS